MGILLTFILCASLISESSLNYLLRTNQDTSIDTIKPKQVIIKVDTPDGIKEIVIEYKTELRKEVQGRQMAGQYFSAAIGGSLVLLGTYLVGKGTIERIPGYDWELPFFLAAPVTIHFGTTTGAYIGGHIFTERKGSFISTLKGSASGSIIGSLLGFAIGFGVGPIITTGDPLGGGLTFGMIGAYIGCPIGSVIGAVKGYCSSISE